MPPSYKVLQKKLRRTHLITRRWLASIQPNPPNVIHEGESTPRMLDVLFEDVHENDSMTSSFGNNGEKQVLPLNIFPTFFDKDKGIIML